MVLNKKTDSLLKMLVKIEKKIFEKYNLIFQDNFDQTVLRDILSLVKQESKIINCIISTEKSERIEEYLKQRYLLDLDSNLMIGFSQFISRENYPYYRIVARCRYFQSKSNKMESNYHLYMDQEVSMIYRLLINNDPDDSNLKEKLDHYAYIFLINSEAVEGAILHNDLEPLDEICDLIEFSEEIYLAADIAIKKKNKEENSKVSFDRIKMATLSRKREFDKSFSELLRRILMELELTHSELNEPINLILFSCYFKTILALLDNPSREYVLEQIRSSYLLNNLPYKSIIILKDFFENCGEQVEEELLPHIKHFSIFPN